MSRILLKSLDPEIPNIRQKELVKLLKLAQNAPALYSVMIWGAPGIGKTDIVLDLAQELGVDCQEIVLSNIEPTDMQGIPSIEADGKYPEINRTVYNLTSLLPLDNGPDGKGGFIFFDEINRSSPEVQNVALKLIRERALKSVPGLKGGYYKVPSKWVIVAAGNRPEDDPIFVGDFSQALGNRFTQVNYAPTFDDWKEWAESKGIDHRIMGFLKFLPDNLYTGSSERKVGGKRPTTLYGSPRSWAQSSLQISHEEVFSGAGLSTEEIVSIVARNTGISLASEFREFMEGFYGINEKDIHLIIENPKRAIIPEKKEASAIIGFGFALSYHFKDAEFTFANWMNLAKYLGRFTEKTGRKELSITIWESVKNSVKIENLSEEERRAIAEEVLKSLPKAG
jgi:hypothetical protein